ncbi:hypothetical protein [Streptomyces sp. NPDC060002]|uniref:hypothetical protein n=1 Tax=Streptomyces sp. NPDC060002 TaxID=3347033 RepID=UPI0036C54C6B
MKFVLEVTVDEGALAQDPVGELGRVLRYRGGNPKHCALEAGDGSAAHDCAYQEVGQWRVVAS